MSYCVYCKSPEGERRSDGLTLCNSCDGADNLVAIVLSLREFYQPQEVVEWLVTPQSLLSGISPFVAVSEGRGAEVLALIQQLNDGVYL